MKTAGILCMLMVVPLAGCTTQNRLYVAQKSFIAIVDDLTLLQELGKFSPQETQQISIAVHEGATYLDIWYEADKMGNTPPDVIAAFNKILDELIRYQASKK